MNTRISFPHGILLKSGTATGEALVLQNLAHVLGAMNIISFNELQGNHIPSHEEAYFISLPP